MVRRTSSTKPSLAYVEVSRVDELPDGVPGADQSRQAVIRRGPGGRLADRESARRLGAIGGRARAGKTALSAGLGLAKAFGEPSFQKYRRAAENFARLHVRQLAVTVGGGVCGPAPSSIIMSAALQLAASRWAYEVKGDPALGSRLANDSRQNLLAAHELCAREAQSRPKDPHEAHRRAAAAFGGTSGR